MTRCIGTYGDSGQYWLVGNQVYRTEYYTGLDTLGMPLGARWECSIEQLLRYQATYQGVTWINLEG